MLGIVTNRQLQLQLNELLAKVDILMTEQDQVNAAAQEIQACG